MLHLSLLWLGSLLSLSATAWGGLALGYQLPARGPGRGWMIGAWIVMGLLVTVLPWSGHAGAALVVGAIAMTVLLAWWRTIRPSNTRVWADDVARQLGSRVVGDIVTLENVRNFEWRSLGDYSARWETRQYDLGQLRSVDALLSYWTGPLIAHVLVSFGFADDRYLAFSIEIRKEHGEAYSALGGFFRKFETGLVAADERDIVRLRSNLRREDVYLYRIALPPDAIRSLFLAYLAEAESLRRRPRWYNTATANCTTVVFEMLRRIVGRLPLDYRLLLSGRLPEYIAGLGGLTPGVDLATLRRAGCINTRAWLADQDPAFSQRIRDGVPGI
nr:DUF4105 domain-containing protein [Solimonas terrae]